MKNKALIGIDLKNDIMKNESGATGCVKSTSYNLVKAGYKVHVISDCVISLLKRRMRGDKGELTNAFC